MGLCNVVVAEGELDQEIDRWCKELLERSPTAIAIAKRSFNADTDHIKGIGNLGIEALALFYQTDESKEGVRAFLERRAPEFRKHLK
jgi:2-ketocyclohexanecarboxyl-CoA hydrolase